MPIYTSTAHIETPREHAWAILADVSNWPAWLLTMSTVEPLDSGPLAIGARYRIAQPKLRPVTWIVTALEPGHRFLWESRSTGILIAADHLIEEGTAGSCTAVLRVGYSGWLAPITGRLFGGITQRYIDREATALAQTARERWSAAPPP